MMTPALFAQFRLARTSGVGPVTYRKAVGKYGSAEAALEAFAQWGRKGEAVASVALVEKELSALEKIGGTVLLWGQPDYPAALGELPDPPLVLSVLGDVSLLHKRQVAIVGNRNASAAGLTWTKGLATALARAGVCVTSGLARGIDTSAHQGALQAGGGTVAVVAGGVDHLYPPENKALREEIIARGAVVSEQPFGMVPTAQLFPRRNRVIAGLSIGVAVCEAMKSSGSLITAQCALDYGREVWAVPGAPSDPRAGGPNWLLKNGATLVEGAADILQSLPNAPAPYVPRLVQPSLLAEVEAVIEEDEGDGTQPASPRAHLYALLGSAPITGDELVRLSGLNESDMTLMLAELELEGHAAREPDGRWRRG
jgi:DNA processing protein